MWQHEFLRRLTILTNEIQAIESIRTFGSVVDGEIDEWSDLDVELAVDRDRLGEVYPSVEWFAPLGDVYTVSRQFDGNIAVLRVVFTDLKRLDLRLVLSNPEYASTELTGLPPGSTREFETSVAGFLFEAVLAVAKIARDDLLIGGHLVLNLERRVLEQAMMLRDRDLGTTIHHHGGLYNEIALKFELGGMDAGSLRRRIGVAIDMFDQTARQLDESFDQDWSPLLNCLRR